MSLVALLDAGDPARFGGKAAALSVALRGGLPVPDGFAIDTEHARAWAEDPSAAARALEASLGASATGSRWAVRSSAVGEDGESASFAGQHLTRLGVAGLTALAEAIGEVHASVLSASAAAYRAKRGIGGPALTGIVLQRLIEAEVAGVLFTRNPMNGNDETVIEASW